MRLTEAETKAAGRRIDELRKQFMLAWLMAFDEFNAVAEATDAGLDPASGAVVDAETAAAIKGVAVAALVETWQSLLDISYREAYKQGVDLWGHGSVKSTTMSPAAERVLEREKAFAFRFAHDAASGPPGTRPPGPQAGAGRPGATTPAPDSASRPKMPAGRRSGMYGQAIEGGFHRGAVDGAPPGKLIWWRLGDAHHCVDCPILASNSPYTRETLPTVPRSGSSECWTSCKCYLEFTDAPGVQRSPPPPPPSGDDSEWPASLRDRIEGPKPTPPPGKRLPTDEENRAIHDLRHRMAFANRRAMRAADAGDLVERDRWLSTRSQINGELIKLTTDRGVWAPPTFSDKEILTSVDLKAGDVDWLTHMRGIDGTTIHRAQASAIAEAARLARADVADLLGQLPASMPTIPNFDDLLRSAGAPEFSFAPIKDDFSWVDPRALTEAAQIVDPAEILTVSLVGLGARATLGIIPAAIEACADTELHIVFGPCDNAWHKVVLEHGVWARGDGKDVAAFVAAISRRIGGRGVEVVQWQP